MTLRAKLLALFLSLAVVPLLALGGIEYVRSLRALEALIAAQNARIAQRAAATIESNVGLLRSDLILLAENAETQRWLALRAAGGSDPKSQREAERFARDAVEQPIRDLQSGTALGTVAVRPALAGTFPLELLASGFGESGHGMVLDRQRGRILYHPNRTLEVRPKAAT